MIVFRAEDEGLADVSRSFARYRRKGRQDVHL
jgi:hypothetical protein